MNTRKNKIENKDQQQWSPHLWQSTPGDVREVVVLIVVANIESDIVEGTIIAVGFKAFMEHVVL